MTTYRSYKNLPALAGIATMDTAGKPGLSVEQCVARLKRIHYALKRLHQIFNNRVTAEPIYELKMGFSLHAHYCAEHVTSFRKRVGEMREPPLGLDVVPDPALETLLASAANKAIGTWMASDTNSSQPASRRSFSDATEKVKARAVYFGWIFSSLSVVVVVFFAMPSSTS